MVKELLLFMKLACLVHMKTTLASYCDLSPYHQLCHPAQDLSHERCGLVYCSGLNHQLRRSILQQHNSFREQLAAGKLAGWKNASFPRAADMMELEWSYELERIAQVHAGKCQMYHDCHQCRSTEHYSVGQNMAMGIVPYHNACSQQQLVPLLGGLVSLWLKEIKHTPVSNTEAFHGSNDEPIGHFTQAVWSRSHSVGCGFVVFNRGNSPYFSEVLLVCNYGPAGNLIGAPLYQPGEPCSKCHEHQCSRNYRHLCKLNQTKTHI